MTRLRRRPIPIPREASLYRALMPPWYLFCQKHLVPIRNDPRKQIRPKRKTSSRLPIAKRSTVVLPSSDELLDRAIPHRHSPRCVDRRFAHSGTETKTTIQRKSKSQSLTRICPRLLLEHARPLPRLPQRPPKWPNGKFKRAPILYAKFPKHHWRDRRDVLAAAVFPSHIQGMMTVPSPLLHPNQGVLARPEKNHLPTVSWRLLP